MMRRGLMAVKAVGLGDGDEEVPKGGGARRSAAGGGVSNIE